MKRFGEQLFTRGERDAYLTQNIAGCGEKLDENLLDASLCEVTANGIELPGKFIELLRGDPERGVVLMEGRNRSIAPSFASKEVPIVSIGQEWPRVAIKIDGFTVTSRRWLSCIFRSR